MKNIFYFLILLQTSALSHSTDDFIYLAQDMWAISSETKGIQVVDHNSTIKYTIKGSYEEIDTRALSNKQSLLVAINKAQNSLDIFLFKENKLALLGRQKEKHHKLEDVCLYKTHDDSIHAFIAKEPASLEHRLIYSKKSQIENTLIRNIPAFSGINGCAVNDRTETLFIAEQNVGVWAYHAHPEGEDSRDFIAMRPPFGDIKNSIEKIHALDNGSILVKQEDVSALSIYQWPKHKSSKNITPTKIPFEYFSIQHIDNKLSITWLDNNNRLIHRQTNLHIDTDKPAPYRTFMPIHETTPVESYGDAADDPAIWINKRAPEKSLILGTDKQKGLNIYSLDGELVKAMPSGRLNNVDLRDHFTINDENVSLVVASNRDRNSLTLFTITAEGDIREHSEIKTGINDIYGVCMSFDEKNKAHYAFANGKNGKFEQYKLWAEQGRILAERVSTFNVIDQPEGCVANDSTGELFIGVEDHGIWVTHIQQTHAPKIQKMRDVQGQEAQGGMQEVQELQERQELRGFKKKQKLRQIAKIGPHLKDDVEGLALYVGKKESYLIASSQGNNSYAFFNASAPYDYINSIRIGANYTLGIDGASETDGLDVTHFNFGGTLSEGMLVVQDGRNVMPPEPQNFKVIPMKDIIVFISELGR